MFPVLRKISGIHSFIMRELLEAAAIQPHRTDVPLPWVAWIGQEKYRARRFVHSLNPQHLKVPLRKLPLQFRVCCHRARLIEAVEVDMHVPVSPARPQELAFGLQETNLHLIEVDPGTRRTLRQNDS